MNSIPTFLRILLTEKGVAPAEIRIVQDNAKRLYSPKRPKQTHVRRSFCSALSLDDRPCRWGRVVSDLSLKAPSRRAPSQQESPAAQPGRRCAASDISLFVSSKSRSSQRNSPKPSRIGNAAWDQFDFSKQTATKSGITSLMKQDLLRTSSLAGARPGVIDPLFDPISSMDRWAGDGSPSGMSRKQMAYSDGLAASSGAPITIVSLTREE
jgi:hypothetical protein